MALITLHLQFLEGDNIYPALFALPSENTASKASNEKTLVDDLLSYDNEKELDNFSGIYSSSGFDILSVLGRIPKRPNPKINLGSVDLSCSFLVVDATKYDFPIVYASDNFETLTGYPPSDIIGKNCRFLQSPDGNVGVGTKRQFTDNNAVYLLKSGIMEAQDVQVQLLNYKKDGTPFMNLVTVIPITMQDGGDVVFFIGFQVDMITQPANIMERVRDGSYIVNYQWKNISSMSSAIAMGKGSFSKKNQLYVTADSSFPAAPSVFTMLKQLGLGDRDKFNTEKLAKNWHEMFISQLCDMSFVLSLKGVFQYCSSRGTERLLGYAAEQLIGKHFSLLCHRQDITAVLREVRDQSLQCVKNPSFTTMNLYFRARRADDKIVWLTATGQVYYEAGRGRKYIALIAREWRPPQLAASTIEATLAASARSRSIQQIYKLEQSYSTAMRSFWGHLTLNGVFLFVTSKCRELLGVVPESFYGLSLQKFVSDQDNGLFSHILEQLAQGKIIQFPHFLLNAKGLEVKVMNTLFPTLEADIVISRIELLPTDTNKSLDKPLDELIQFSFAQQQNPADDWFGFFSIRGDSSAWQYQMHQLRLRNKKLEEDIDDLSLQVKALKALKLKSTQTFSSMKRKNYEKPCSDSPSSSGGVMLEEVGSSCSTICCRICKATYATKWVWVGPESNVYICELCSSSSYKINSGGSASTGASMGTGAERGW